MNAKHKKVQIATTSQLPPKKFTQEKLQSIMEAASALTSLVQEETGSSSLRSPKREDNITVTPKEQTPSSNADSDESKEEEDEPSKRFIPEHKKPDAALTFPEKLMSMMEFAEDKQQENYCAAWLPDGKSFVIRNPDEFTRQVLPNFFKATKFSSFTRKLYRWGFRQVNRGIGPDDPIIFGNEFFQREDRELMTKMRSITAASTRKQEQSNMQMMSQKRALESMDAERDHKRVLLEQIMQQKAALNQQQHNMMGGMNVMNMNLTNVLRPNLGNGGFNHMNMGGMKPFDMLAAQGMPQNNNSLMNSFSNMQQGALGGLSNSNSQFPNAASTAEIVNAAINALRYAP